MTLNLTQHWWREIGMAVISTELCDLLRGLVGATLTESIPPKATPQLIEAARYVDGIWINIPEHQIDEYFVILALVPRGDPVPRFQLLATRPDTATVVVSETAQSALETLALMPRHKVRAAVKANPRAFLKVFEDLGVVKREEVL